MDKRLGDVHLSTDAYEQLMERLAQAEAKAWAQAADDLREWRQANATNYHTSQGLLALERKWRGACCPTCGVVGGHGLVHSDRAEQDTPDQANT
jgi:uncharacterized membrane protein YccC